ncbi:MAG: hypothetical protein DMF06_16745 [Verrucomicrobia bacterium]|nr:MAG: hypothetical protein DMF06_16745 [Verrucomicrobiota bacterium]
MMSEAGASALDSAPPLTDEVPDLAGLSFVETYRILKSASPDLVRSYCNKLEQLPLGPSRTAALSAFFRTLIQVNPVLTKDIILGLKKDDRWLPTSAIRETANPRGMETVAEVMLSFDRIEISSCSYDLLRDILDEWGKNDPLALKQFLETHRDQDVERYFDKLVVNWAAYDPEGAREWMAKEIERRPLLPTRPDEYGGEEIFDSEWRSAVESMSSAWVQGFLAHDPDQATQYVVEHADNPAVKYALNWLAGDLFLASPDRARDLINRLPEEQQSKSLGSQANGLVRSDDSDNATSPRYVAEWMLNFPPETYREDIGWVLRVWEMSDPQELFAWMADLPAPTRDQMINQFPGVSSETTQEDFDTVMQVPDPALRTQLLERLARDATYAERQLRRVLEKSTLPAEEKARLASLIPKPEFETVSADEDTE